MQKSMVTSLWSHNLALHLSPQRKYPLKLFQVSDKTLLGLQHTILRQIRSSWGIHTQISSQARLRERFLSLIRREKIIFPVRKTQDLACTTSKIQAIKRTLMHRVSMQFSFQRFLTARIRKSSTSRIWVLEFMRRNINLLMLVGLLVITRDQIQIPA